MRAKFYENYANSIPALIRLTEAHNPFFENIRNNSNDGYRKVKAPTLIFAGEHDRAIPLWMQQKLLDIYPNSRMYILPDCGHLTYFEEANIFWENFKTIVRNKTVNYELECNKGLEYVVPGQKCRTIGVPRK
jgi:pimeloyl-ACP methyl ester carboxylesterase